MTFRPGQHVLVSDAMRGRIYEGVILYSTQDSTSTRQTQPGWVVRWTDERGNTLETHRLERELMRTSRVLRSRDHVILHALRYGARKTSDTVVDGVRQRTYTAIDFEITTRG